jgi:predicted amidohydrolase
VALVIYWDHGSPEAVREAALGGADLVLAPAGWRRPWDRQYELACAARALDNAVYLASANQMGDCPEAGFDTPGGVYGPNSLRVCERTGSRSVTEVDLGPPERWRSTFGSILPAPIETLAPHPLL